jgi:hypothetical protein
MASSSSSSHDPFSPPPATLSSGAGDEPSSSHPRIDFQHADERDADDFIAAAGATPLRVAAVAIKGLQRTSRPIVERELSNLKEARTLDEIKAVLLSDWESLQTLGIFSAVELVLDECSPVSKESERGRGEKFFIFFSIERALIVVVDAPPDPSTTFFFSKTKKNSSARPRRLPRRRHFRRAAQAVPQHGNLRPRHGGIRRAPRLAPQRGRPRRARDARL